MPAAEWLGNGGAEGVRTLDPHVANVVLSQLSYRPILMPPILKSNKWRVVQEGKSIR